MNFNDAKKVFNIDDDRKITNDNIKKIYKKLCFKFHPDAHLEEERTIYEEYMKCINIAYSVLKRFINKFDVNSTKDENEQHETEKQIIKEQILMDILVKAYYSSKEEIDEINSDFFEYFQKIPSKVGKIKDKCGNIHYGYRHTNRAFIFKAEDEYKIMAKYIKKYAIEFANRYEIKINIRDVVLGDYINFLNNTDWYDKYLKYNSKTNKK